MDTVRLGDVEVGLGQPPYIIAEIGSNHNGDMALCRKLIQAAAHAGAHAAKFQSWSESSLIAKEEFNHNTDYSDKKRHFGSLREMVVKYQLTPDQHREARAYCQESGIAFCSSPFSNEEVDLLDSLDVPFLKIASMDVVNLPLLKYAARKGRPLVISTGMATLAEIEQAVSVVRAQGNDRIILLHCVSIYPPEYDSINLRNMTMLEDVFDVPVGFSDHTLGTAIPLAAIGLGACVIEKHFTLDQDMEGWDHAVSATPEQLRTIVEEGLNVFRSRGTLDRVVSEAEFEKRKKFRRSLVARRSLPAGHVLAEPDLVAKRPGTGIAPDELEHVLGRKLARAVTEDEVIRREDLA
jgi:N,N'-diacetyllegionaminate synthase